MPFETAIVETLAPFAEVMFLGWLRASWGMTVASKAHVVHHIPGRARVRIPSRRHDEAFFREVDSRLNAVDGIRAVTTPQTGGVLIHYRGDFVEVLLRLAETGLSELIELETDPPPIQPLGTQFAQQVGALDGQLKTMTGGYLDGRTVTLLSLLLATGLQLARGQVLGPAVPLLWYAVETVRNYFPDHRAGAS